MVGSAHSPTREIVSALSPTDSTAIHAEAPQQCYWLIGNDAKVAHVRIAITSPVLVGRAPNNQVVIDDSRLSRQHSRFAAEREGCVVYDLASANGTWVNGVRIHRHVLQRGDVVRVGSYEFRVDVGPIPSNRQIPIETQTLSGLEAALPQVFAETRMLRSAPGIEDSAAGRLSALELGEATGSQGKLETLYAFMKAVTETRDRRELLRTVAAKLRDVYGASVNIRIHLRPSPEADHVVAYELVDGPSRHGASLPDDVRDEVVGAAMAVLARLHPSVDGTDMYAPIIVGGNVAGVIHVTSAARTFTSSDLELLNGLASPVAIMLQNMRMQEQLVAHDRLDHDLTRAAEIQKSFLPREIISVEGVDLVAEYRAAYGVGGDFYDVFWVAPNRLGVFIGDISGKGVSAALLMARLSSELRVAALAHIDPVKALSAMNQATVVRGTPELFFTAVYFTVDVTTGEVLLANAGHCTPYVVRYAGRVEPVLEGSGGPIGILDDTAFESTSVQLLAGDSLVLYTDGVVEAANALGTLYGQERLETTLALAGSRPNVIAENIVTSVRSFAGDRAANDDLTLLVLHRSRGKGATLQPRRRSASFPPPSATVQQPPTPTAPVVPKPPTPPRSD